jgi:hypothetical protein
MQTVDLSKPGEKKKLIGAAVLGLVAILVLWWTLIGFDSGTPSPSTSSARPSPTPAQQRPAANPAGANGTASTEVNNLAAFTEINYAASSYSAPEAKRNIFAYYEPPPPAAPAASVATPTPEPPPPILLASVSPTNVYARTGDFKLEVAGDKFTPAMRIYVDGREFPTTYQNPQQLSTNIEASLIANPGARQVVVRTPDNSLYSNPLTVNVAAPPAPTFTYIGIISPQNRVGDTALVQERNSKDIISAYRGDVLGGRFRVTSISEKELVVTDTTLKIKHSIPKTEGDKASGGPLSRPTPRVDAEDDEP